MPACLPCQRQLKHGEAVHAIEIIPLIIQLLFCSTHNKRVFCRPVHVDLIVLVITIGYVIFSLYMTGF